MNYALDIVAINTYFYEKILGICIIFMSVVAKIYVD